MTKQTPSNRRTTEPTIIAIYRPDVARQVQALRLILDVQARKRRPPLDVVPMSMDAATGALDKDEVGNVCKVVSGTETK